MKSQETVCSVVAADPAGTFFGVATVSSATAIGKTVPFTGACVGAMAVQGNSSPYFGVEGMKLLRKRIEARKIIEEIMSDDPIRESRQILILGAEGNKAAFTGSALPEYAGSVEGDAYIIGGCGLADSGLLAGCGKAFEQSQGDLPARLLAAVAVVAESDSNRAPVTSVALRISKDKPFPYLDLRVDSHEEPVTELSRVLAVWREKNDPLETGKEPGGEEA